MNAYRYTPSGVVSAADMDMLRFISFVRPQPNNGCWLWMGRVTHNGYAVFNTKRKLLPATHFILQRIGIEIPQGHQPDHLCKTPCCVNPFHLQVVTRSENIRRSDSPAGINARRTHCTKGHPFNETNTVIDRGRRRCKICRATSRRKLNGTLRTTVG